MMPNKIKFFLTISFLFLGGCAGGAMFSSPDKYSNVIIEALNQKVSRDNLYSSFNIDSYPRKNEAKIFCRKSRGVQSTILTYIEEKYEGHLGEIPTFKEEDTIYAGYECMFFWGKKDMLPVCAKNLTNDLVEKLRPVYVSWVNTSFGVPDTEILLDVSGSRIQIREYKGQSWVHYHYCGDPTMSPLEYREKSKSIKNYDTLMAYNIKAMQNSQRADQEWADAHRGPSEYQLKLKREKAESWGKALSGVAGHIEESRKKDMAEEIARKKRVDEIINPIGPSPVSSGSSSVYSTSSSNRSSYKKSSSSSSSLTLSSKHITGKLKKKGFEYKFGWYYDGTRKIYYYTDVFYMNDRDYTADEMNDTCSEWKDYIKNRYNIRAGGGTIAEGRETLEIAEDKLQNALEVFKKKGFTLKRVSWKP